MARGTLEAPTEEGELGLPPCTRPCTPTINQTEERDHPAREPGGHRIPQSGLQPDVGDHTESHHGEQHSDPEAGQGVPARHAAAAGERAAQGQPVRAAQAAGDDGEHTEGHGQEQQRPPEGEPAVIFQGIWHMKQEGTLGAPPSGYP